MFIPAQFNDTLMTKKFKIGIDYGGTKIEGILLDPNGEKLERKKVLL